MHIFKDFGSGVELDAHLRRFENNVSTAFRIVSSVLGELDILKLRLSRRESQMDPGLSGKIVSPFF